MAAQRHASPRTPFSINASDAPYRVTCDGTTDDTVGLNRFLAALGGRSGVLPAGTCVFTSTLRASSRFFTLSGSGKYTTTLKYAGVNTTIDLLYVGRPPGDTPGAVEGPGTISGLRIQSATTMTAGAGLHLQDLGRVNLRDVVLTGQNGGANTLWNGIWSDENDFILIDGFEAVAQNDGLRVSGPGAASGAPQYDLWIQNGKIASSAVGVHVGGGTDNLHFDDMEVTANGTNVVIDNTIAPYKNQEIVFGPGFVADHPVGDDYYIDDALADPANFCNIVIGGAVTRARNGIHVVKWPACPVSVSAGYIVKNVNGIEIDDATASIVVSPQTALSTNAGYGITASIPTTHVQFLGLASGNGLGNFGPNIANADPMPGTASARGHLSGAGAALPTSSSGTVTAGSTDLHGSVILPAGRAGTTITFASAFFPAPFCTVSGSLTGDVVAGIAGRTTLALMASTGGAAQTITWLCLQ